MILTLVISSIFLAAMTFFTAAVSGTTVMFILDIPSIVSVLFVFVLLVLLTGYGKDFKKIFSSKKDFASYDLTQIGKIEKGLDVSGKLLLYSSFILPLITLIYLLMNDDKSDAVRQHLGPNLAVVFISIIYMCFLEMIIHCLKLKVRKAKVLYMAEPDETVENKTAENKVCLSSVVKFVVGVVVLVGIIFITGIMLDGGFNWGKHTPLFAALSDLPSLIIVIVPSLVLLAVSGNWKEFFGAFKTVFSDRKITVTEKSLYVSAVKNVIAVNIYAALYGAFIGFIAILCNLEDVNYLYQNCAVALIPVLYASILNLVLYLVEIRVNKVAQ